MGHAARAITARVSQEPPRDPSHRCPGRRGRLGKGGGRGEGWAIPATNEEFAAAYEEERPLFAFPGNYRQWKGPIKKAGPNVDIEVFSFMTTLPNALTATINHERSPVLLTEEEQFSTWLTGSPQEAFGLIRTSDADRMRIVQSGYDKEDLLNAA
jgi:putative SOS response-associated peptidase YedK